MGGGGEWEECGVEVGMWEECGVEVVSGRSVVCGRSVG